MELPGIPEWIVGCGMPKIGPDVGIVCLVFSREEVEGLRVGRAVDDLMHLSDDMRLCQQLQHGLFVTFDGWGDDPREVHQIAQCREYLTAVHRQWPYWLHFLAPSPDMWAVLLLFLATRTAPAGAASGKSCTSIEAGEIGSLIDGMLNPLTLLHDKMGLSQQQGHAIFERSWQAISETMPS
jgi:hypothetical protein